MNAQQFIDVRGRDAARRVAEQAGTSYGHFKNIARGSRRPSVELAKRLSKASEGEMDVVSLLLSVDWDEKRKAQTA